MLVRRAVSKQRRGLRHFQRAQKYRAIFDFCNYRHETIMPVPSLQVRYEGMNGLGYLAA
jgi:hypothetical protein